MNDQQKYLAKLDRVYNRLTVLADRRNGCDSNLSFEEMREYLVLSQFIDDHFAK